MSTISKKTIPADYDFYKDRDFYFFDVKVNPLYSLLGKLIAAAAVKNMKKQVRFDKP